MGVYFLRFSLEAGGGRDGILLQNMMPNPQLPHPNSPLFYLFIYLFIYFFSHTLHCRFIQVLYMLIFGSKLYSLAFVHVYQLSIIHLCGCCGSNFLPGLFFSLCVELIIIHYHTPKQRDIIFKPRMKLNHNMHS